MLRRAGIAARLGRLGYRVEDAGDIESPTPENTASPGDPKARYLAELVPVLEDLAAAVRRARDEGRIPLVLGGNHSVGLGALSGMTGAGDPGKGDGGRTASLGLIWVDAHPDANTPETTVTGNLSGMPLAAIFGRGRRAYTGVGGFAPGRCRVRPENTVLIGIRSVDEGEDEVIADIGVRTCTMAEVDRICERLDWRLEPEARGDMEEWLVRQEEQRRSEPPHRYSLDDFGLTPEMVDDAFAPYRDFIGSRGIAESRLRAELHPKVPA